MHLLFFGILLGIGAAIPIGPVNLEIIRRNLRYGTWYGLFTGMGASLADVIYLVLLCLGALTLLQYPMVMRTIGIIGSIILAWFAYKAFCSQTVNAADDQTTPALLRYLLDGFIITLINPYTILFWSSVSAQVSLAAAADKNTLPLAGAGVVIGTIGWVFALNTFLHFTRHRLTTKAIKRLNYTGGVILLGFSLFGFLRVLQM
jgi:L-lysine exporter family protein LysE/ArgO